MSTTLLVSAIRGLAAGAAIDWNALESAPVDASVMTVLEQLRIIGRIADLHGTAASSFGAVEIQTNDEGLRSWGPLTIIERVGEGSYGVVYRAWDSRLDREVALKILRTECTPIDSGSPAIDEGRLLARVRHSNVVTVYGADRIDGRVGLWMEFVSGRTLDEIVRTDGPLPIARARDIWIEVARGLSAVHRAGIVHRDVKAQNVIVQDDGRVVLMDFGSGHAVDNVHSSAAGTPLYVAPEVLAGEPATPRSDVYSLGVLVYYLVTGEYPRTGTTLAELKQQTHRQRSDIRRAYPHVPRSLAATLARALAPSHERFTSVDEFARALRGRSRSRVAAVGVLTAIGAAAMALALGLLKRPTPPVLASSSPLPAVIVSHFENNTGDSQLEPLVSDTFERELSTSHLAAPASDERVAEVLALMRRTPGGRLDVTAAREVALRDGDIQAVITGRMNTVGKDIVISVEAVNPIDGAAMDSVAEPATSKEQLTSLIHREAVRISEILKQNQAVVRPTTARLRKVTTPSLHALQLYSEAASVMGDGLTGVWDNVTAQQRLEDALHEDPEFASAHILIAWAIANQRCNTCPGDVAAVQAHLDRALALAPRAASNPERQFIIGSVHSFRSRSASTADQRSAELRQAIAAYEVVVQEQPDHQWAPNNLAGMYLVEGRTTALAHLMQRISDVRATSFSAAVSAAAASQSAGDAAGVAQYGARARKLMTPETSGSEPEAVARLHLLSVQQAWLDDDPRAALEKMTALEAQSEHFGPAARQIVTVYGFYAALALGRLHDAERRVLQFQNASHDINFARLLKERREPAALRAFVGSRLGQPGILNMGVTIAESGFVDVARDIVRRHTIDPSPLYSMRVDATIASVEQRWADVLRLTGQIFPDMPYGDRHVQVSMLSADALVALGRRDEAIEVLERTTAHRMEAAEFGYRWMDARAQLATLYHQAGREQEARAIEDHLLRLLMVADSDHPLLVELHQRVASRR